MKRRLLFLCHTFPFPPDGGVWIRTFNVLRLLARTFEITGLCFERATSLARDGSNKRGPYLEALRTLGDFEVFELPQLHSRRRFAWDHLRSIVAQRVYTRYLYDSIAFRTRLQELLLRRRFDLVHVDSLDLSGYLDLLRGLPTVCVHHNIESELLVRRAASETGAMRRAYIRLQAHLTEDVERKWCERVDLNVTVSERDALTLRRIAPRAQVAVVPNGVDVDHFSPTRGSADRLVFVGGTSWFPNKDALYYFAGDILPLIRQRTPQVGVEWVGRATEAERGRFQRDGLVLTGYVDDIRSRVGAAKCYVVPLRVGGGSRLKILDAWAMGKAVVSTSVGCEGLEAFDGKNILIRDTPESFAAAIAEVLENAELRHRLEAGARRTVETLYSWDVVGKKMLALYSALVENPRRTRG